MADQEKPPQPAAEAPGRLPEEDRHGFVSAFVGGVRPDGEQGKPGKRLVAIGIAVVAALSLGALAIGALSSPGDKKNQADKVAPAGATAKADHHQDGKASPNSPGGNAGGTGGQQQTVPDGQRIIPAEDSPTTGSTHTPPSPSTTKDEGSKTVSQKSVPSFTALAGYGCPSSASAKIWAKDPNFSQEAGWLKSTSGGYTGSGCNGQYLSLPMSGSSTKYDATQYVLWKFDYRTKIKGAASCRLAVFVPGSSDIRYVGGHPAKYAVYASDHSGGTPAGSFDVDQVNNHGKWLARGPFKVDGGFVTVKMFNTGIDYTSSTKDAHDAAGPVQLSCTPA
ncbi:hypothetical protein [Streptomyces benahoarensis]|uniref:Uncharacterized protein n=1 Tax=Streptomyces benahoarensis TaxID=2595054 RepID=A0A553ZR97_9ACTN|nr:hypothetical protein [Streptomyces benahoarensis]TSB32510.1 hypothetical protein FNJ62_01530 [Streptomyces benahoarensis]TSB43953.1 hypothetical protein FNZ23_01620 [Streptomyces benahoarensis]